MHAISSRDKHTITQHINPQTAIYIGPITIHSSLNGQLKISAMKPMVHYQSWLRPKSHQIAIYNSQRLGH